MDKSGEFKMCDLLSGRVVGIVEFQGQLIVALETGVFMKGDDDVFRPMVFEEVLEGDDGELIRRHAVGSSVAKEVGVSDDF